MNTLDKNQSTCIIGNLNIDLIIRNVPRIPRWGTEVFGSGRSQVSSGQAGYLAFALQNLGIPSSVISLVGDDIYGQQILRDLNNFKVNTRGVSIQPGSNTGITVAFVRGDGERAFISDMACLKHFDENMILSAWDLVEDASTVCLVGVFCLPGLSLESAVTVMKKAAHAGKTTILDTGWDPNNWNEPTILFLRNLLQETTIFLPNWDEARAITKQNTVEKAAKAILEMGAQKVVIKCGERGSYTRQGDEEYWANSRKVKVFDAVGAGDVFNAGFLYGYQQKWPLEECLAMGNLTASIYISRENNRFPKLSEIQELAKQEKELFPLHHFLIGE